LGKGTKVGIGVGTLGAIIIVISLIVSVEDTKMIHQELKEQQELRNLSIEELEELSVSWYYDDLLRNPEKYKGEIIFFEGKIFRVDLLDKDRYAFIVWVGDGLDQLVVEWYGSRLLDGDEISGYAEFEKVIDMGSMLVENYYNPKPYVNAIQITCHNC